MKVSMTNGEVQFNRAVPGRAATAKTTIGPGGAAVTVNESFVPEIPAHYEVTFRVDVERDGPVTTPHCLILRTVVIDASDTAPYRAVEDAAARQLPAMLREIAAGIQCAIDEAAARLGQE